MPLQLNDLNEIQMREIHAGLLLREAELKKAKKTYLECGLNAQDAEYHLTVLQGGSSSADRGLLYMTQSQLDAIVESDLKKPKPKKGEQIDHGTPDPDPEPEVVGAADPAAEEPSEFEVDVRLALGDERMAFALDYAMNSTGPLNDEWHKDYFTDDDLLAFVGAAFGKGGSNQKDGPEKFAWRGGKRPAIWMGQMNYRGNPALVGDVLIEVVRRRYNIARARIGAGPSEPPASPDQGPPTPAE